MRNQGLIYIGIVLIVAGILFLVGNVLDINVWAVCFPAGLILLGIFVLLRPSLSGPDTRSEFVLIGELERVGQFDMVDEEVWSFIADSEYDLTKATIPKGETLIRAYSFVNDLEIIVPESVGVAIDSTGFVTELDRPGFDDETYFLAPMHWQSDNYKTADRRVRFELTQFVGDITLRQV